MPCNWLSLFCNCWETWCFVVDRTSCTYFCILFCYFGSKKLDSKWLIKYPVSVPLLGVLYGPQLLNPVVLLPIKISYRSLRCQHRTVSLAQSEVSLGPATRSIFYPSVELLRFPLLEPLPLLSFSYTLRMSFCSLLEVFLTRFNSVCFRWRACSIFFSILSM